MAQKYLIRVTNLKVGDVYTTLSSTEKFAISRYRKLTGDNSPVQVEFIKTLPDKNGETYPVTYIRSLKQGTYFRTVDKNGKIGSTVYVKDSYDRSSEKYYAYKFHDVCSGRLFHRNQLVCIDFTF